MRLFSRINSFPREDDSAPRMQIIKKECGSEYAVFKECVTKNDGVEGPCLNQKEVMVDCGKIAFRKANNTPGFTY